MTDRGTRIDEARVAVQPRHEPGGPNARQAFLDELTWSHLPVAPRAAAEAVLCTLARRLSSLAVEETEALLPDELAWLIERCDRHEGPARAHRIGAAEFVSDVADHLGVEQDVAARAVRAVFDALRDRLPEAQVEKIASQLPLELADWFRRPV